MARFDKDLIDLDNKKLIDADKSQGAVPEGHHCPGLSSHHDCIGTAHVKVEQASCLCSQPGQRAW
jgi:hypothetical protein